MLERSPWDWRHQRGHLLDHSCLTGWISPKVDLNSPNRLELGLEKKAGFSCSSLSPPSYWTSILSLKLLQTGAKAPSDWVKALTKFPQTRPSSLKLNQVPSAYSKVSATSSVHETLELLLHSPGKCCTDERLSRNTFSFSFNLNFLGAWGSIELSALKSNSKLRTCASYQVHKGPPERGAPSPPTRPYSKTLKGLWVGKLFTRACWLSPSLLPGGLAGRVEQILCVEKIALLLTSTRPGGRSYF